MKLEFIRAVTVEGKKFLPGDVVDTDKLPELGSYFDTCVRMGHAVEASKAPKPVIVEPEDDEVLQEVETESAGDDAGGEGSIEGESADAKKKKTRKRK